MYGKLTKQNSILNLIKFSSIGYIYIYIYNYIRTLLASRSSLSLLRDNPPLGFLRVCLFFYFLISAIMVDDVTSILVNMKLTSREEEVIEILDEGRKEGMESYAHSLIGKFLTCRPFNRKAAIITLKRAWGLEEGVQMIEVGTILFQLKFQFEFEMNRVFKGGPWSFDNQVLMLIRWKVGITADNVKFESVSLWVQIWGTLFDLVSPTICKDSGK